MSGAIKDSVLDYEDIAIFACRYLRDAYPQALVKRYRLSALPAQPDDLLDAIAAKRGSLGRGGVVDRHKVSELLIREMRMGKLGPVSFETPADIPRSSTDSSTSSRS